MRKMILFQGDSITDNGRSREDDTFIGKGYPLLVKSHMDYEFPGEYDFVNRGISGNRIVDIYARIKKDIINVKPDVLSILVGVNDVWHEIDFQNGVDAKKYELIYRMLLEEILKALPDLKIMIMEPYVVKGCKTEVCWDYFRSEVQKRAEIAEKIAASFQLDFIPLQEKFDEVIKMQPSEYWTIDGVHPTIAGHELISREWLKAFRNIV